MKNLITVLLLMGFVLHLHGQAESTLNQNPKQTEKGTTPTKSGVGVSDTAKIPEPKKTTNPVDTTQKQLDKIIDQLADLKKIINENGKDQSLFIGKLILSKTKGIKVYSDVYSNLVQGDTINIDSMIISTREGHIVDIQVICDDKRIFRNGLTVIPLTTNRFESNEGLICKTGEKYRYIYAREIFKLITKNDYIPNDESFTLTPKDTFHLFYKSAGLNTVFDIRLYSDALGLFGGKSNGLAQTDVFFKQILHRTNMFNRGIFLFNNFKFNFNASKFDSKVGYTDSSQFSRTSLFQKSWLNTDLAINVINGWLGKRTFNSYFLDFGGGISLSNLAKQKDTSTITSTYLFFQPGVEFKIADNIGSKFSTKFIWTYSPQIDFNNQDGQRLFIKPSFEIFWNPIGNEASRIFGRVAYNVEIKDKKSHFLQLQFGYTLKLSSLVK